MLSSKGVDPLIGVVLLVILTVSVASGMFIWGTTTTRELTEKAETQRSESATPYDSSFYIAGIDNAAKNITIKNNGKTFMDVGQFSVYLDGSQATITGLEPASGQINPGQTLNITILESPENRDVRVIGPHSTSDEIYFSSSTTSTTSTTTSTTASTSTTATSTTTTTLPCGFHITANTVLNAPITGCTGTVIYIDAGGITLDCAGHLLQTTGNYSIRNTGHDSVTVKNCRVEMNGPVSRYGIFFYNSDNGIITGNDVTASHGRSIYVYGYNNRIAGNNATAGVEEAIRVYRGSGNNITGNKATASGNYAIQIYSSIYNNIAANDLSADRNALYLYYSNHSLVNDNDVTANDYTINLYNSVNNIITGNDATANDDYAIYLRYSDYNDITGNNLTANDYQALYFYNADRNEIKGNNLAADYNALYLNYYSSYNQITDNNASALNYAIRLQNSSNNNITGNKATATNNYAVRIEYGSSNNITSNSLASVNNTLYLYYSNSNRVRENNATATGIYAIRFSFSNYSRVYNNNATAGSYTFRSYGSIYNRIYNNIIRYSYNSPYSLYDSNYWNRTQRTGPNIIGGPYLGGNYWTRVGGGGFSDTCTDTNGDGFCDNNYTLTANNIDYLPLKP